MKYLDYVDDHGYIQRALVRDNDNDPLQGIPIQVPNIESVDWEQIKRKLHYQLLDHGLLTLADVQQRQGEFIQCIVTVLKKPLLNLYQEQ